MNRNEAISGLVNYALEKEMIQPEEKAWAVNGLLDILQLDASVQTSWSGKTATLTFASTASNPLSIGIHLNHGTSIDDLKMTGFTYSVN